MLSVSEYSALRSGIFQDNDKATRQSPQHGCIPAEPASVSPGKIIVALPRPSDSTSVCLFRSNPEIARLHVPRTLFCGIGALARFRGNSTGIKAAGWRTERPGRNCSARHYDRVCHRTCINQPRGQLR